MKAPRQLPSVETLEHFFDYDPVQGVLFSKKTGKPVGTPGRNQHMIVFIRGAQYALARVAWKMYYRKDPGTKHVYHHDKNHLNNSIDNLYLKAVLNKTQKEVNIDRWELDPIEED